MTEFIKTMFEYFGRSVAFVRQCRVKLTAGRDTRSPATAGKANRPLLFLEHRIPMPELFTELRFSVLQEFWTQEIRLPLLGGDAPRL